MFESKVSITKTDSWGEFSALRNPVSNSKELVAVPCPTHPNYSITNICKTPQCIEPLCPQCITSHVELHQKTKKSAKIENIVSTRVKCIDRLVQIQEDLSLELKKYENSCGSNLEQFIEKNRKKIDFARNKIQNFVLQFFEEIQQKMEMLEIAYLNQRERKSKELKIQLKPMESHFQQISQYREQLQSYDYIPALIQLLNSPPKKPSPLSKPSFQDLGEVVVNQKAFEDLKVSVQSFLSVNSNIENQKGQSKMNQNGSRFSNQMQFSKLGRSSSRDLLQSKLSRNGSSDSRVSRDNSRKKIFSKDKGSDSGSSSRVSNSVAFSRSAQQQQKLPQISNFFSSEPRQCGCIDYSYFRYDKGILAFFPPNQHHFFAVDPLCAQTGFQRLELPDDFIIPYDHKCVVTPQSRVYLIGGKLDNRSSNQIYQVIFKFPTTRAKTPVKKLTPMKDERFKFAAAFYEDCIYVFGGRSRADVLSTCQKYDLRLNKWDSQRPLLQPLFDMNVCVFNHKILMFGGTLQTGQILNRIDVFYPASNEWARMSSEIPFFGQMGSVQISKSSMIIFGGQTQFKSKKGDCFLVTEEANRSNLVKYKISPLSNSLYTEASFESCFTYKNSVLAIQNEQNSKQKTIMRLQNEKWNFLAC